MRWEELKLWHKEAVRIASSLGIPMVKLSADME